MKKRTVNIFERKQIRVCGPKKVPHPSLHQDNGDASHYETRRVCTGTGIFIQYGLESEELEAGSLVYSSALVEMKDGTVKNVAVENIKFVS